MIFLNTGEDYRKHECISEDEAQCRYPEMRIREQRPHEEKGRKLRKIRVAARVTMCEMSSRSKNLEDPAMRLTPSGISNIEMGRSTIPGVDMVALWKRLIGMKGKNHDSL